MMVAQQLYEGVSLGKASVGLITYMRTDPYVWLKWQLTKSVIISLII